MKKLLLFTALISASFASFCPAAALRHAAPVAAPRHVAAVAAPAAAQATPAATPLNAMVAQLLASITKPGALTADVRLQAIATNVATLQAGLDNVFVRDLDETAKNNVLKLIKAMQEEVTQLFELFKDATFFNQYNNRNCKELLDIQKTLGELTEKINPASYAWLAGKSTLSWMNNNRIKTVVILVAAPFVVKATSTAGYHAYQSGFNPFKWVAGTVQWAVTPAYAKATPIAPIAARK